MSSDNEAAKTLERIHRSIRRYPATLMNNTKWREVLDVIGQHNIPVQFSFVREDDHFKSKVKFPVGGCAENHTLDCTAHGPFYFKEIFAMRCERYNEVTIDLKTGKRSQNDDVYQRVIQDLMKLGQLPIEYHDDSFTIYGYQK